MELRLFTSESVSEGHPDKICDQISDGILDAYIAQDKNSRVACEVFITTQQVVVGGEIRSKANIDVEKIVRDTLREIGYTHESIGINADTCKVLILLHEQSADIAIGVDETNTKEIGAGDQGIMFGYAINETKEYMPLAISIAHKLVQTASLKRKNKEFKNARPDMKSQVTIDYTDKSNPKVNTILMSIQHDEDYNEIEFKKYIKEHIVLEVLKNYAIDASNFNLILNPTGRFVIGGPDGDTGLTGRKIIVDSYGGSAHHGGGAFSGKDFTKVDRSAAYAARYVSKNIVAAGLCTECEIQLSYAIGVAQPTSIHINTNQTNKIDESLILSAIREEFDLTPFGIVKMLDLQNPIYKQTATYGHFGRTDLDLPWERLNRVESLKKYLE